VKAPLLVFPQKSGTGERRKCVAASPTKPIWPNPIFELELTKRKNINIQQPDFMKPK
jgi:hypothetical protein